MRVIPQVKNCRVPLALLLALIPVSQAWADGPGFETFRWNEDYRYLHAQPSLKPYEQIKYNPFELAARQGYISVGGSVRSRVNLYRNDRFGLQGGRDGEQWLQRFYGHVDIHLGEGFRTFIELDAGYTDTSGALAPGPFDKDKAALGQAFIDWHAGGSRWRLGRQEMGLGSARLMGTRDATNIRRSYDGLRWDGVYSGTDWRMFYLQEVQVDHRAFSDTSSDRHNTLWGLNTTWGLSLGKADLYYLGLKQQDTVYSQGIDDEARHSVGTRLFGSHRDWDWDIEALYQFGRFGEADIHAWTVASIVGYRFPQVQWQPRLALGINIASGDKDTRDTRLGTFNPLFPNLAYFEEAALHAPQNFYNIEPEISWVVTSKLGVALDWNFFWRLEESDATYVRGLTPLAGTAEVKGHFVAHTPSISIDYQWNRHLGMDVSYSHFFARQVITRAGGDDVDFFKVQVEWKF